MYLLVNILIIALLIILTFLVFKLSKYQKKQLRQSALNNAYNEIGNLGLNFPLPWGPMAAHPKTISDLVLKSYDPSVKNIIECGSGISTLCIASVF